MWYFFHNKWTDSWDWPLTCLHSHKKEKRETTVYLACGAWVQAHDFAGRCVTACFSAYCCSVCDFFPRTPSLTSPPKAHTHGDVIMKSTLVHLYYCSQDFRVSFLPFISSSNIWTLRCFSWMMTNIWILPEDGNSTFSCLSEAHAAPIKPGDSATSETEQVNYERV